MASIMIVDDSPIIRRSLRAILEEQGHYIAVEAEDARAAIELYKHNKIDLITMDIQLPDMSGIEAVRLIRERNPQAVIVIISSVEQKSKVYAAIKMGAKHYIVKPFTAAKIKEVIHAVLGGEPIQKQVPKIESVTNSAEENNSPPKKPEPLKLEAPMLSGLPFELHHMSDRITLIIQRHINNNNVRLLHHCLISLLYFRKVKYVLEFWEPVQHNDGYRLLLDFIAAVRDRKGTVGVVTSDEGYFIQLQAKLRSGVYRSHKEINW
ncbi:response regulator [Paenibacillus thalictri]|uniref:Response regulator n=2 Tax=Paenibacillus thalictri TaxID=2527873 RepID=A0A4Q9DI97_9BACL|nr:response regulator [Paenibacillus thalictri]